MRANAKGFEARDGWGILDKDTGEFMKKLICLSLLAMSTTAFSYELPNPSNECLKSIRKIAENFEALHSPEEAVYRSSLPFSAQRWNDRKSTGYGGQTGSNKTTVISPVFMKNDGKVIQYNFNGSFDSEICKVDSVDRIIVQ